MGRRKISEGQGKWRLSKQSETAGGAVAEEDGGNRWTQTHLHNPQQAADTWEAVYTGGGSLFSPFASLHFSWTSVLQGRPHSSRRNATSDDLYSRSLWPEATRSNQLIPWRAWHSPLWHRFMCLGNRVTWLDVRALVLTLFVFVVGSGHIYFYLQHGYCPGPQLSASRAPTL